MIKGVVKQMWQTEDGLQFESKQAAEIYERALVIQGILNTLPVNWPDVGSIELADAIVKAGYELKRINPQAP